MTTFDWRQYDQKTLDAQYDNHAAAGPAGAAALARLRALSMENQPRLPVQPDIAYGDAADMRLDLYPMGGAASPALVLVHGGGWLGGDTAGSGFWAAQLADWGIAHLVVTHTKRPKASLGRMAAEVTAAWRFIRQRAPKYGLDPARLHLAGISSGATLAALAALALKPAEVPASLLLLGGMYDLDPVRRSARNAALDLTETDVAAYSPLYRAADLPGPAIVTYGEHETAEFRRQARAFAERVGPGAELMEIAGANHFSQSEALLDPSTPLARSMHARLTRSSVPETVS
jgi:arylformamidase